VAVPSSRFGFLVAFCLILTCAVLPTDSLAAEAPAWAGHGAFRLLVRVSDAGAAGREGDLRPASVSLDFRSALAQLGSEELCDPGSIQVIQHDPVTGEALLRGDFALAASAADVPFRLDQSDPRPHWWLHSLLGDGQKGTLTFTHRRRNATTALYAIYFDSVKRPEDVRMAPRAWIGDGDALFREEGPLPSLLHTRPFATDWDADGRMDLLVGYIRGYVFYYRNVGSAEARRFQGPYFVEADGQPLKVEWYSAPRVVDFDGDGLPDLLVGHDPKGSLRYYQNVGTPGHPQLTDKGPVLADGSPITCPHEPVPESPGIFSKDYTGIPEIVDWNGDGRLDVLMGGYVTGRVFYFENTGNAGDGTPTLTSRGPLLSDGEILDVIWQASPTVADIDGDGLLELVTGSMYVSPSGGEAAPKDRPGLFMFRNVGTRTEPVLRQVPFPLEGPWVETFLLNPRFADWNGDGLLDLVVGAGVQVSVYLNIGTPTEPRFSRQEPLRVPWVARMVHPDWMGDFDADGKIDLLQAHGGSTVTLSTIEREQNPPSFSTVGDIRTAAGSNMCRPPEHGDPWAAAVAHDWDGDGDQDMAVGDVAGFVWYYENTGTATAPSFAEGLRLALTDGTPLVAGIDPNTPVTDFTVLQGNRAVPACADFDGDGRTDLVTGDAVGGVTYFHNEGTAEEPVFSSGRKLAGLSGRVHVAAADMTGDGRPDLIVSQSGAGEGQQVMIVETRLVDGAVDFAFPGRPLPLAWIPYPQPSVVDINRDGDLDIVLGSSYSALYLAEGSYIREGTAVGEVVGVEGR